jgi:DNA-binding MarR family transcriptional regulator
MEHNMPRHVPGKTASAAGRAGDPGPPAGDPLADLAASTVREVLVVNQLLTARLERSLRPVGLSITQLSILSHLAREPGRAETVTGLARVMQQTQPTTTKAVQSLGAKGLVRISADPTDSRRRWVSATGQGVDAVGQARDAAAPDADVAFGRLGPTELAELRRLLVAVRSALDAARG